jgi:hypothetical protein
MKFAWVPAPADGTTAVQVVEAEEREGSAPLDRLPSDRSFGSGVDTAVSIEREVVSGHAYAILAPQAAEVRGRCGYDKPTNLSVDGVVNP